MTVKETYIENSQIIPIILIFRKKNTEHQFNLGLGGLFFGFGFHMIAVVFLAFGQKPHDPRSFSAVNLN